jgi:hypothetical protein
MTPKPRDIIFSNYYNFELELSKIEECEWAGLGWPKYLPDESLDDTIYRIYKNDIPDWVIFNHPDVRLSPNRKYSVGLYVDDIHAAFSLKKGPEGYVSAINNAGFNAVFARYIYSYYKYIPFPFIQITKKFDPYYYINNLRANLFHLPHSINQNIFKPNIYKKIDVCFIGRVSKIYPIRTILLKKLPSFCRKNDLSLYMRETLPRKSDKKIFSKSQIRLNRNEYGNLIGQSKIFIFDSSIFKYSVRKYFEGMACKSLVLSDVPQSNDSLHLIPDYNFIEINEKNWSDKILYYVNNSDVMNNIITNGYKTVMTYHTDEVRAKEFIDMLNGKKDPINK